MNPPIITAIGTCKKCGMIQTCAMRAESPSPWSAPCKWCRSSIVRMRNPADIAEDKLINLIVTSIIIIVGAILGSVLGTITARMFLR